VPKFDGAYDPTHSLDIASPLPSWVTAMRVAVACNARGRNYATIEITGKNDHWVHHASIRVGVQAWRNTLLPALTLWCRSQAIGLTVHAVQHVPTGSEQ